MQVNSEDITVAWGQAPHPLDAQYGKWRMAVFQDVQESIDGTKLYFLYDPQADEQSGTSGQRKGYPGLIIFDLKFKCFAGEISVHSPGKMKFLFALKCPSPQGGSAFVLVTEEEVYGQVQLNVSRIDLAQDGLSIANVRPLIQQDLTIGGEYICSMREDQPEIVVMANPGLQIWRINCMAESAQPPVAQFTVPGADLIQYAYGLMNNGNIIFLSATPDGHFDNTRVHLLSLNNPQHITSQNCSGDPQRGMPIPRKQCGFDSVTNAILMAGGEVDRGNGFERLVDYWVLNTQTFQWLQTLSQMPFPLNEPCLTACHSGKIYVWGDCDEPLPGMKQHGTHLRILRVSGLEKYSTYNPAPPAYPSLDEKSGGNPPPSSPSNRQNPSNPLERREKTTYKSFTIVPGSESGYDKIHSLPAWSECCLRETNEDLAPVSLDCVGANFEKCIGFKGKQQEHNSAYFVRVKGTKYICLNCHSKTGCQIARRDRVKQNELTQTQAANHITQKECGKRRGKDAGKTKNIFIFLWDETGALRASNQFIEKGGHFNYRKFDEWNQMQLGGGSVCGLDEDFDLSSASIEKDSTSEAHTTSAEESHLSVCEVGTQLMEMTIQEVKTHDRAVKTEVEEADEEYSEMMPYTRQELLNNIQSMASIMALPIAPEKLNRNIVLNWRVFKISDITSMFHEHFDNWWKKQVEATGNVRHINQVFTMLYYIFEEDSCDDLGDVRKTLKEAIKETETSVKCIALSTISESLEAIIDTLLAGTELTEDL